MFLIFQIQPANRGTYISFMLFIVDSRFPCHWNSLCSRKLALPLPLMGPKNALARPRGTTWSSLLASTMLNGRRSTRSPGWPRSRRTRGNVKIGERKQHKLDQEAKKASMNALRKKKQATNNEQKAWLNALLESNPDAKEGMEQHGFCKIKECMPDEVMTQFVKIAGDTAFYGKAGTTFNDKPFYRDAWCDDEIPDKGKEYCEPPWSPLHPPLSLLGPEPTPFVRRVHV